MIEQSVRIHDRHQVEIKLAYRLGDFEKSKSYDISLFFFLPASLGITPATYSKRDFFNDLIGHVRIKTPAVLLRDMGSGPGSPLKRLEASLTALAQRVDKRAELDCERQLKMFCCILKSALRDHVAALADRSIATDQKDMAEQFLSGIAQATQGFRALRGILNVPAVRKESFSKYLFADEFISLVVESYAYEMLEVLRTKGNGAFETYKPRLLELVGNEITYRTANGYPSVPDAASDNEILVFRKSVLKKYVESVLFLGTRAKREGTLTEQTIFAIAAGLSMVFATGVAFFAQLRYGNMTFPLFVALVISYMLKDRIKELLRKFLNTKIRRFFSDRQQQIFSDASASERIGTCRESFDFARENLLPTAVWRLRSRDHLTEIENGWVGETIILYRKRITLLPDWFRRAQAEYRIEGINEILRLKIFEFLARMDEPKKALWYRNGSEYREIAGQRVYHINLVSRCRTAESIDERRFRIVLTKEGIKRIESVNAEHMTIGPVKPDDGLRKSLLEDVD